MVLKALKVELALPAHTFATLLVCTPYLDCICVTHDILGTTSESSMAARGMAARSMAARSTAARLARFGRRADDNSAVAKGVTDLLLRAGV